MKHIKLGNFEEIILLLIGALKDEAYSVAIVSAYQKETGSKVNISAIHTVLYRLEDKGFLSSQLGETTAGRGGKRKRHFKLTDHAVAALNELALIREELRAKIPALKIDLSNEG